MQAFFEWRRGLDPARRAQADDALVLLRQADLDAKEDAERASVEKRAEVPEMLIDATESAGWFEVVYRRSV